jgi:predicted phage-related endonuclease
MKILKLEQNSPEWLEARKAKIMGSKLKDIIVKRGTEKKIGFYQLIADRLAQEAGDEDPMDRGHRLEEDSLKEFEEATGLKLSDEDCMWISDKNPNIGCSPDGYVTVDGKITIAVETKSLSSARHLQAYITKEVPDEYKYQMLQYFIVNPDLETLYFCFYDPRVTVLPFFYLEYVRESLEDEIKFCLDYQTQVLAEVDKIVNELAF